MHYETDRGSDHATLFFGQHNNYVLVLNRENLAQIVSLGAKAIADLEGNGGGGNRSWARS